MTREELTSILKNRSGNALDFAKQLGRSVSGIEEDLEHIRTSIRTNPDYTLLIQPAICLLCDYQFKADKAKGPTKCPSCKRQKIQQPSFKIVRK